MLDKTSHPEQDPAEGSRKVIDRELARQRRQAHSQDRSGKEAGENERTGEPTPQEHRPN